MSLEVIAFTGPKYSGKDTAAAYVGKELELPVVQISAPLREICRERGQELTRENLIRIGAELAGKYGDDYLARLALERVEGNFLLTGVRQVGQIALLRSEAKLQLVAVTADVNKRFERAKQSASEDAKTLEEFIVQEDRENRPPNPQDVYACMDEAKWTIKNNGSIADLQEELEQFLRQRRSLVSGVV